MSRDEWFIRDTFTNVATGASILSKDVGPDHIWIPARRPPGARHHRSKPDRVRVIGGVVIDLDTDETLHISRESVGSIVDQVCDAIA